MEGMITALALVVKKETTGELVTNIADIEQFVSDRIKEYNPDLFEGDADRAKKARAELNKGKKQLADTRREVIDRLMKPYQDFEERCKALERLIDTASGKLDAIVKIKESDEKEAKRKVIEADWNSRHFDLFPLEKVFDKKWLNKTAKITDISAEISAIIERTYKDLKTIERFADDAETLKAHYLMCLNIGDTLDYGQELQKKRELARKEEEERAGREHEERIAEQRRELVQEQKDINRETAMAGLVADAIDDGTRPEPSVGEYTVTVCVTESQLVGIKNYLTMQGIEYECNKLDF